MQKYNYRILLKFSTATLIFVAIISCAKPPNKEESDLKIRVAPLSGVYVHYDSGQNTFRIGNELIERRISVNPEKRIASTVAFINKVSRRNYTQLLGKEFSFRANGTELSGITGDFEYVGHEISGAGGMRTLAIDFRASREGIGLLMMKLFYEVYDKTPAIRKWFEIRNSGGSSINVDSILVEALSLAPGSKYNLKFYKNKALSPVVFDAQLIEGFFLGNEAPGALKYYDLYSDNSSISIGMTQHFQEHPMEIQLAPGESFTSPPAFIFLFKGEPGTAKIPLREFVTKHITWSRDQEYSVWYEGAIAESELQKKAKLAVGADADIFCLARKWMDKQGDWNILADANVKEIGKYIRSLDMKFGLSMKLAIADQDSQIIAEYPQLVVKSEENTGDKKMMCLGSDYSIHVAHQLSALAGELELDYIKLTGPMIPSAGCSADEHLHRSRAESLWYIYDGFLTICRYLHSQHPGLIVDVSPESYSSDGKIDYALLKHADIKWPTDQ